MSWITRLPGSFHRNKRKDQLDEELQFHIEMRPREFIATGMTPEEARHQDAAEADRGEITEKRFTSLDR